MIELGRPYVHPPCDESTVAWRGEEAGADLIISGTPDANNACKIRKEF